MPVRGLRLPRRVLTTRQEDVVRRHHEVLRYPDGPVEGDVRLPVSDRGLPSGLETGREVRSDRMAPRLLLRYPGERETLPIGEENKVRLVLLPVALVVTERTWALSLRIVQCRSI